MIKKFLIKNMTLNECLSIINEIKEKVHGIPRSKGVLFKTKLNDIFNKNNELEVLQ